MPLVQSANGHILVVDDLSGDCPRIASLLAEAGYQVTVARDKADAVALATVRPPDVVLLDAAAPLTESWELQRQLSAGGYVIPVIVVSQEASAGAAIEREATPPAAAGSQPLEILLQTVVRLTAR